jgi:hypothetical protein
MRDSQSSTCTLGERRVAVAAVAPETCVATLVASAGDAELCAHTHTCGGGAREGDRTQKKINAKFTFAHTHHYAHIHANTHPHRQQRQKEGRNLTKPAERFGDAAPALGDESNLELEPERMSNGLKI